MALDISTIPFSTLSIMAISVTISFINIGLTRVLISRMVGWHEYRSMQKEISEFNAQKMKAMRANDAKLLEKLKKKQSQINSMQMKMSKPQLLLLPITAIYFVIWPIMMGYFPNPVAYVPGIGQIPFFYWYMLCSFFLGTLASKAIGITPIE